MTNPEDYIRTRVDVVRRTMYQKRLTRADVSHVCSETTMIKMMKPNPPVKMRTADKIYTYLRDKYDLSEPVAGEPFEEWRDKAVQEMESYREMIGMSRFKYGRRINQNLTQYYELMQGKPVKGRAIWRMYKNYLKMKGD